MTVYVLYQHVNNAKGPTQIVLWGIYPTLEKVQQVRGRINMDLAIDEYDLEINRTVRVHQ